MIFWILPLLFLQTDSINEIDTDEFDLAKIEALADTLFSLGEYDAAALEYKRLLYYSTEMQGRYIDSVSGTPEGFCETFRGLKLALALYRNGEFDEADSIIYELDGPTARIVRAVLLIEEDNPYLAALAIDSTTREVMGARAYKLRGWAYFEAHDFWNAAREFSKAGKDSLGLLVGDLSDVKLKNPRTARWLSLIPGWGETYAGKPLFGLWALLVNAGDTYLIVDGIIDKRYLDAFLVYTFLWQRFYAGSMTNASQFAYEWNERKLTEVMDPIREEFGESKDLTLDLQTLHELYRIESTVRD
ncbi:hypothetical protein GF359_07265 [candidate division WOR-3 bacterium]|uniref:Tetratricopeptide repeat protein n=1 Tax=candidate division WOR-3 bacterium TaxID=2052148 RepID=A0A9D5KBA2_UNCW3|nr:hypothetical protein [candidate division WOR-3 bacterium]MBD3364999.1 hypothetical protein [candidate division WOR-3 bacterium]